MTRDTSPQMALPLVHADKASFDNFLVGRNTELVAGLKKICGPHNLADDLNSQVTYCYGPSGSGKSHLLFACIRAADKALISARSLNEIRYISLSNTQVVVEMLALINVSGLVCVDDVHAWAGDRTKERALFTLFEQIKHAGGQLLVCGLQPPSEAGFVINDLVSRLASGLLYPVYELNDQERLDAIKLRANQRGLKISDDAVKYLLNHSSRDTRELFQILDHIDKASLAQQRRITIPFLQRLLAIS